MRGATLCLLAVACASPSAPGGSATSSPAIAAARPLPVASAAGETAPPPAFVSACAEACSRKHMMRAVGAAMIDAECAEGCRADWSLPLVIDAATARAHADQRVRARGRWSTDGDRPALALADGALLSCVRGIGLETAAPATDGDLMWAVGLLADGSLTDVSTLAPAAPD